MKKIKLVVVGKLKEKFFADACSEYLKRLQRFATVTVTELKDKDGSDEIVKESDDILRAIEGKVFLTDIGGELLSSEQLSASMKNAFLQSDTITFVIGGSRGVDDRVRAIADKRISFGRMTFPHMLMRAMTLEQIYRAFTIAEGLPYHK